MLNNCAHFTHFSSNLAKLHHYVHKILLILLPFKRVFSFHERLLKLKLTLHYLNLVWWALASNDNALNKPCLIGSLNEFDKLDSRLDKMTCNFGAFQSYLLISLDQNSIRDSIMINRLDKHFWPVYSAQ